MILSELVNYLDSAVPLSFQEDYDNSGLQIGSPEMKIESALITLDITEDVIDEAVKTGSDVIISHHPLIFNGLKRISGESITERLVLKAIRNNIAVYSAHTNLDIAGSGVSRKMGEKLGLKNISVLRTLKRRLYKLVTFIPADHLDRVREKLFEAGAGHIGNYDRCGYTVDGSGSFRAGDNTNPFRGTIGETHSEKEIRFETILFSHLKSRVIRALLDSHPYEEPAYDIYLLENDNIDAGLGCVGELPEAMDESDFLNLLSSVFSPGGIRYSALTGKKVRKVALCGGSGSALLKEAVAVHADVFVTGDVKYHSFFEADNRILIVDCGHYETEKYSVEILYDLIIKKFPNFALRFSETNTNPINYL